MQIDFKTEMEKRTDEELIRVLTVDKDDYLPEAFAVAPEEFERRNLEPGKMLSMTKEVTQKKEIENKNATGSLDFVIKLVTFLFPLIVTLILSMYYRAGGYDKKAREVVIWTLYGFGFYMIIILITQLL